MKVLSSFLLLALSLLIVGFYCMNQFLAAGVLGFAFLLVGAILLTTDWDAYTNELEFE